MSMEKESDEGTLSPFSVQARLERSTPASIVTVRFPRSEIQDMTFMTNEPVAAPSQSWAAAIPAANAGTYLFC